MGGASKTTVGYKYFAGFQMMLAKCIEKITRIRIGDVDAWNGNQVGEGVITINNDQLFGGKAREGGVVAQINFQPGYPTQMPDSYLASKLGRIPAFRGVAGIVCRHGYLGNNPYMKDWKIRASRIHTQDDGSVQWYDETAQVAFGGDLNLELGPTSEGWKYKNVPYPDTADYSAEGYDDSAWGVGSSPFADKVGQPYLAGLWPDVVGTVWPQQTTMWIRRQFTVNTTDTVTLVIFVDNFATCWVNGVLVLPRSGNSASPSTEAFQHEIVIPSSVIRSGVNTIACKCEDAGPISDGNYAYAAFKVAGNDALLPDMNPVHMLRECLLNQEWGFGYDESDVDDDNFRAAALTLFNEGFGLSYLWDDDQTEIDDVIQKIEDTVDLALYVDRRTLKWTIKLIRGDYDKASLPVFSEGTEIMSMDDFARPMFGDLVNLVVVQFYNLELGDTGTLSVPNPALFLQQGVLVKSQKNYEMVSNANLASRLGSRDLKAESNPLATGTVSLLPTAAANDLQRGDPLVLNFGKYSLNDTVVRVTAVTFGDGTTKRVKVSFVEDDFALPDTIVVPSQSSPYVDPKGNPVALSNRLVMEVPYFALIQSEGQAQTDSLLNNDLTLGFVAAAAPRVTGGLSADIYTDAGAGFQDNGHLDFCAYGELSTVMTKQSATFTMTNTVDLDELDTQPIFQVDSEIMALTALDTGTGIATGVLRGLFDTVPATHAIGAKVYFFENYLDSDNIQYESGETVNVKLLTNASNGQLSLAAAPTDAVLLAHRAIRPYAPGNLKVGGTATPSAPVIGVIPLTWAHRNRQTQADVPVDTSASDVTPEVGTTYTVKIYLAGVLDQTFTGIATNFYNAFASEAGHVTAVVFTERLTFESWQGNSIDFDYVPPDTLITTSAGNLLTTPSGIYLRAV
jgi:hypothetical protein